MDNKTETVSDDELIAKFMGGWNSNDNTIHLGMNVQVRSDQNLSDRWYDYKDMNYSTSWDWLIPVVHKIRDTEPYRFTDAYRMYEQIRESLLCLNIEMLYKTVVEFIKWYNHSKT